MNRVILKGRLTKDVEIRYTQSAEPKAVASFSVAVNRPYKKDEVDFINCSAWGKTAEFMEKYFRKGQEILLEGRIQIDTVDKDGSKVYFTKVVADQVEFCGSKGDTVGANNETNTISYVSQDEDDDLPF